MLVRSLRRQLDVGTAPWINTDHFSIPVYTVPADQPKVSVILDEVASAAPELARSWRSVPIPADAVPSPGTDNQIVVYQPSTDSLWEFFVARRVGGTWHARWGGTMRNVSSNPGYFSRASQWGATATGLAALGGLIRIRELQAGRIDHALAMSVPETARRFVFPARRGDGRSGRADAIPLGTRFRIDPDVDLAALDLPGPIAAMARAAQRYGIVVRDTAGGVVFYGEQPQTAEDRRAYAAIFGGESPGTLLKRFPWKDLQAVRPAG